MATASMNDILNARIAKRREVTFHLVQVDLREYEKNGSGNDG